MNSKPSFAIVGCGRVGTVLGRCLKEAGYPPAGAASKSLASAQHAAGVFGVAHFSQDPLDIVLQAEVVFLTTPDGVIAEVCDQIAGRRGFRPDSVVLHCSGAHPSTILSAAAMKGASTGSMHPLQSIASPGMAGNPFSGIVISVEGESRAVALATQMAVDLGARCREIRTQAKVLYHAAAVTASNYLVTVLDLAFRLIETAGISRQEALEVLNPLITGTLRNIAAVGIPDALTGPIARGDYETVERHLLELSGQSPDLLPLYKALGLETIPIAHAKGALPAEALAALHRLLKPAVSG